MVICIEGQARHDDTRKVSTATITREQPGDIVAQRVGQKEGRGKVDVVSRMELGG